MLMDQPAFARVKVTMAPVEVRPSSNSEGVAKDAAWVAPSAASRKRRSVRA